MKRRLCHWRFMDISANQWKCHNFATYNNFIRDKSCRFRATRIKWSDKTTKIELVQSLRNSSIREMIAVGEKKARNIVEVWSNFISGTKVGELGWYVMDWLVMMTSKMIPFFHNRIACPTSNWTIRNRNDQTKHNIESSTLIVSKWEMDLNDITSVYLFIHLYFVCACRTCASFTRNNRSHLLELSKCNMMTRKWACVFSVTCFSSFFLLADGFPNHFPTALRDEFLLIVRNWLMAAGKPKTWSNIFFEHQTKQRKTRCSATKRINTPVMTHAVKTFSTADRKNERKKWMCKSIYNEFSRRFLSRASFHFT